ncbi:MAG: thiamine pyrophosphate-binding protein, partial [Polyangiaceae bacterium]|nr:thiamine pyrophosphate-binding protein [Polyangiaceae bacterium]
MTVGGDATGAPPQLETASATGPRAAPEDGPQPPLDGLLNPVGAWSLLLVDALAQAGVQQIVITPGSRSTPFVLAALRHGGLDCTSLIDERVASFHALGFAKATQRPTALLCTSGSAPAHYLPALIEASLSYVPLVVLSADRPLSLQDCGAPQTIDQVKLFGDHVRFFGDLGHPETDPESLLALRRMVVQAVAAATHPRPGPVHLNARARKPLEPRPAQGPAELDAAAIAARLTRRLVTRASVPEMSASQQTCDELA